MELNVVGDCSGFGDRGRAQQLLNDLVINAIQYGEERKTVGVTLRGDESEVVAHGGRIVAVSEGAQTLLAAHLPRDSRPPSGPPA